MVYLNDRQRDHNGAAARTWQGQSKQSGKTVFVRAAEKVRSDHEKLPAGSYRQRRPGPPGGSVVTVWLKRRRGNHRRIVAAGP